MEETPQSGEAFAYTVPEVEVTTKGFKILSLTRVHIFRLGGIGICDSCNEPAFTGKYIAVLNSYYCGKCFADWHSTAHYYPEDQHIEEFKMADKIERLKS